MHLKIFFFEIVFAVFYTTLNFQRKISIHYFTWYNFFIPTVELILNSMNEMPYCFSFLPYSYNSGKRREGLELIHQIT